MGVGGLGQNFDCSLTCHTTHPFVVARPALRGSTRSLERVRGAIEARVSSIASWATASPMYGHRDKPLGRASVGAEAVMNASALALGDQSLGRPPSPITLRAMDLMWSAQRDDGSWDWFDFHLEPWEAGPDVGIAHASLAVSSLPSDTVSRARTHVDRLAAHVRRRLADRAKPLNLHDRTILLWASARWLSLLSDADRRAIARELVTRQQPDGGWSLAGWGRGKLAGREGPSDGYATALATIALCEGSHASEATARSVAWLRRAQRPDGSWPARSVNVDKEPNNGFMVDAASAYAVIALSRCGGT
jgi:squalene-hopene/tetraprenyl-beta-curcumene cyclase